jgi:hypothetical protein
MSRMTKEEIIQVKKAIADIIYNNKDKLEFIDGEPNQTKVVELLKTEYGYDVSRQTVSKYLKSGLGKYRQMLLVEDNEKIRDIKEAMRVQKQIWKSGEAKAADRTKAANAWRQLQKQMMQYEKQLAEAEIRKAEVSRPNYLIKIEPKSVLVKCPKCGHEWYDIDDHEENKKKGKWKPAFDKDDEEQKTFDDYGNDNNE